MTKQETAESIPFLRGKTFDYALPQQWVNEVKELTGRDATRYFVWLYDEKARILGRPYPIVPEGLEILKEYDRQKGTKLAELVDRDEGTIHWYRVWYCKTPTFFSDPTLTEEKVRETHEMVAVVTAEDREGVFQYMQGEIWSPHGEARPLIEYLGLHHTSMSVGDVVEDVDEKGFYEVQSTGYRKLPNKEMACLGRAWAIIINKEKIKKLGLEQAVEHALEEFHTGEPPDEGAVDFLLAEIEEHLEYEDFQFLKELQQSGTLWIDKDNQGNLIIRKEC